MDPPWEPPLSGTELEHLAGALDRLRYTFRWKAGGLDAAGLSARIGASTLTLGGLLKHLTMVESLKFTGDLGQRIRMGAPEHTVSLRRLLYDLVEEYGRHTGHADLLREAVDGLTGEDPPHDWRP